MHTIFEIAQKHFGTKRLPTPERTDQIISVLTETRRELNNSGEHWVQNNWVNPNTDALDYDELSEWQERMDQIPSRHDDLGPLYQDEVPIISMCLMGGAERAAWIALGKPDMSRKANCKAQAVLVIQAAVYLSQFISLEDVTDSDGCNPLQLTDEFFAKQKRLFPNAGPHQIANWIESANIDWNDTNGRTWQDVDAALAAAGAEKPQEAV